jgi:hypothetical protein
MHSPIAEPRHEARALDLMPLVLVGTPSGEA